MEDIVDAMHGEVDAPAVADVADVEFDFVVVELLAHVVLLLLVAGEDADLGDVRIDKSPEDGMTE